MANGKSLFLGVLVGSAAGALATLLSTPSSGRDLRIRVKEQSLEWKELIESVKQDGLRLKRQIAETSHEGATLMKNLTEEMKKSVDEWKQAVAPHQENIHEYLGQLEASLKDLEDKVKQRA